MRRKSVADDNEPMTVIHAAARQGFSSEARTYACGRPEYPPVLLDWLATEVGARPGKQGVDLGAGPGKFTRSLARTAADVVAVEPVDAMLVELSQALPAVRVLAGQAEDIPLPSASVDAVLLVVADARRSPSYGCALRLDRHGLGHLLGRAEFIHRL
jgi:SAM-dependent methyltransferase